MLSLTHLHSDTIGGAVCNFKNGLETANKQREEDKTRANKLMIVYLFQCQLLLENFIEENMVAIEVFFNVIN